MAAKKITISDIAAAAQVSKTTVSRYLNGKYEYMSPETRQRIQSIIEMTDYQPNTAARTLKSQKSSLIGLVVADIESPFSSAVIKQIGDRLIENDYNLITANCDNSYEKEVHYLNSLMNQQVDGLIVNTTSQRNPLLIEIANRGIPVVLLDRFVDNYSMDIAYFRNRQPVFNVVDHLAGQGYGTIAFFVQPYENISPRYLRRDAFIEKMLAMGVSSPEQLVYEIDTRDEDRIRQQLIRLMEQYGGQSSPPAVIAENGVTLLYLAKAIRSLGLKMPHEIGLCGYDEWGWETKLGWAGLIDVGLTTLDSSTYLLGDSAASLLLRRIQTPDQPPEERAIDSPLTIRGSTLHGGTPADFSHS